MEAASAIRSYWNQVGQALNCLEERQAIDRYAWPLPLRLAGYITALSALGGILPDALRSGSVTMVAAVALWAPFIVAFHLFSGNQYLTLKQRVLLFLAQIASATVLLHLSFGAELLYYMLAAEIQFLLPFRAALAGTLGLWMMLVGNGILAAPATFHTMLLQFCVETPAGFVFVAAFTRSAVTELIQRHRSMLLLAQLHEAHVQLQEYADRVEELTVVRERNRMAREIHDTIGHYLTVINVQIEAAQKLGSRDPERSQAALTTAKQLATECLTEVRRSVSALRPAALEDVSLAEALGRLITDMRQWTDMVVHVESQGHGALQPAVEVIIYRAIQEALTNVRKHASARNVWVRIDWNPEWLVASVRDDGRGAVAGSTKPGSADGNSKGHQPAFGLQGMRERLARVGGTLEIDTAPGAGFSVTLRIPRPTAPAGMALSEGVPA